MATATIILADGFEEIEALAPVDILRRGGIDVIVVGLGNREIIGSHEIVVRTNVLLADYAQTGILPDALILPGGMPGAKNLADSLAVKKLADEQFARGGIIAAICAAPALTLGQWGMLNGRRATCYPDFQSKMPAGVTYSSDPVVVDQNIITANGAGSALAFGYQILAALTSPAAADEIRKKMLSV